jgi:hypothetical protein
MRAPAGQGRWSLHVSQEDVRWIFRTEHSWPPWASRLAAGAATSRGTIRQAKAQPRPNGSHRGHWAEVSLFPQPSSRPISPSPTPSGGGLPQRFHEPLLLRVPLQAVEQGGAKPGGQVRSERLGLFQVHPGEVRGQVLAQAVLLGAHDVAALFVRQRREADLQRLLHPPQHEVGERPPHTIIMR